MPVILKINENVCQISICVCVCVCLCSSGFAQPLDVSWEGSLSAVRQNMGLCSLGPTIYWQEKRTRAELSTESPAVSLSCLPRALVVCCTYDTLHISTGKNEKGPTQETIWKKEDIHFGQWQQMVYHVYRERKSLPLFKGLSPGSEITYERKSSHPE